MPEPYRGSRLGWGPWRRRWISICSRHREHQIACRLCMTGRYSWAIPAFFSRLFYRRAPRLWRWWVNRPNSKIRRHLEEIFPGLGGGNCAPADRGAEPQAKDSDDPHRTV